MSTPADPTLVTAMAEIEAVCKKHDIGAVVSLHSNAGAQLALFTPSWSLWREVTKGKGDMEMHEHLGIGGESPEFLDTVTMILTMRNVVYRVAATFQRVVAKLTDQGVRIVEEKKDVPSSEPKTDNVIFFPSSKETH